MLAVVADPRSTFGRKVGLSADGDGLATGESVIESSSKLSAPGESAMGKAYQ